MKEYLRVLKDIRENGCTKEDRTGTGTISLFGTQMRFNLQDGFPLVTTKKTHLKSIIHELLWFLQGDTNTKYLNDNGVKIWDEWADENGDLGRVYGAQWRDWKTHKHLHVTAGCGYSIPVEQNIDQIENVVNRLKTNPDCRRLIVSAWNPGELDQMALAPCHCLFQFNTRPMSVKQRQEYHSTVNMGREFLITGSDADYHKEFDKLGVPSRYLDCQLYQRSCDFFLGVPFNIASYALLTMMIAQCSNMAAGDFIWTGGDTHLYLNHLEQADEQLARETYKLPTMKINPDIKDIFGFKYEDFNLIDYECHPTIKAPISV